ncbi:MAG: twin-arginine translocase TatA/TatE family subunit [Rhodospirillales bacterium]|nr:twin-arginine translocase TatA/TatE family subunit [Rhodospirillales bacterium]
MGIGGIWQWVVVLVIVLILFGGRGKISQLMGDFGKGLKSFKKGVKEDGPEPVEAKNTPRSVQASSEAQPEKPDS